MKILTSDPQRCIQWLSDRLGYPIDSPVAAYAVLDNQNEHIIAAVVFGRQTATDIHINLAGRAALSRFCLRINAEIPFNQLGCHRLTALTRPRSDMYNLMERLGFTREGVLREYYPDWGDAIIWSLLKWECRWF